MDQTNAEWNEQNKKINPEENGKTIKKDTSHFCNIRRHDKKVVLFSNHNVIFGSDLLDLDKKESMYNTTSKERRRNGNIYRIIDKKNLQSTSKDISKTSEHVILCNEKNVYFLVAKEYLNVVFMKILALKNERQTDETRTKNCVESNVTKNN